MAALRERAARRGHSMQQEIRDILAAAAKQPPTLAESEPVLLRTVRTSGGSTWRREEIYGDTGR